MQKDACMTAVTFTENVSQLGLRRCFQPFRKDITTHAAFQGWEVEKERTFRRNVESLNSTRTDLHRQVSNRDIRFFLFQVPH